MFCMLRLHNIPICVQFIFEWNEWKLVDHHSAMNRKKHFFLWKNGYNNTLAPTKYIREKRARRKQLEPESNIWNKKIYILQTMLFFCVKSLRSFQKCYWIYSFCAFLLRYRADNERRLWLRSKTNMCTYRVHIHSNIPHAHLICKNFSSVQAMCVCGLRYIPDGSYIYSHCTFVCACVAATAAAIVADGDEEDPWALHTYDIPMHTSNQYSPSHPRINR